MHRAATPGGEDATGSHVQMGPRTVVRGHGRRDDLETRTVNDMQRAVAGTDDNVMASEHGISDPSSFLWCIGEGEHLLGAPGASIEAHKPAIASARPDFGAGDGNGRAASVR